MRIFLTCLLVLLSFNTRAHLLVSDGGIKQELRANFEGKCAEAQILKPTHAYISNTLESIEGAFQVGADAVIIDVQATAELSGEPDNLVLFSGLSLDCRTNARCENGCQCNSEGECQTNLQNTEYLQSLDMGYGLTFNEGENFPLRSRHQGAITNFREAAMLLERHSEKQLLIRVASAPERSFEAFMRIIGTIPVNLRRRIHFPYSIGDVDQLKRYEVPNFLPMENSFECFQDHLLSGPGELPNSCREKFIILPIDSNLGTLHPWLSFFNWKTWLWGWPNDFTNKANLIGSQSFVSHVNSRESFLEVREWNVNGIITDKIEIIGPLVEVFEKEKADAP